MEKRGFSGRQCCRRRGEAVLGLGAMLVGDRIDVMMMARGEGKAQRFEQSGVMDEPFYKFRVWNCKCCKGEWE